MGKRILCLQSVKLKSNKVGLLREAVRKGKFMEVVNVGANPPTIQERIKTASLKNHKDLLVEISQLESEIEKSLLADELAKKLGVRSSAVKEELKTLEKQSQDQLKAVFPELVDLALDGQGQVAYMILTEEGIKVMSSWKTADGETYRPPGREHIHFALPRANKVLEHFSCVDESLFDDLLEYFKRFSYLPDEIWPMVVASVFLSYMQDHQDVRYIPILYFHAVAERGKSRTAKSILSVAYRGIHLVDLKSANIFRFAENLKATLFFDCTDLWSTAEKSDCKDILLGRFEKGCRLARVQFPDRGAFLDQVYYDVYGSTIVATNEPANVTFESRCLTITMPNKPGDYEDPTPEKCLELKERLIAWRARMMSQRLPSIEMIDGISGRLWDITKPVFQVCAITKPSMSQPVKAALLEMAGQKVEDKMESLEGQLVAVICDLAEFGPDKESIIPVETIRQKLNVGKLERYRISPQKLGKRIKSLSLETKIINGYARLYLKEAELAVLCEQYGLTLKADDVDVVVEEAKGQLSKVEPKPLIVEDKPRELESGRESQEASANKKPLSWNRSKRIKTEPRQSTVIWKGRK